MYYLRRQVFNKNFTFHPANSDSYIFSTSNSEQSREAGLFARAQSIVVVIVTLYLQEDVS